MGKMKGRLITFEGIDNCGKTTQTKLLEDYLRGKGVQVVVGREPGGTSYGETVRMILKHPEDVFRVMNTMFAGYYDFHRINQKQRRDKVTEILFYMAARREFVVHNVLPALKEGKTYIADRYSDSTRAYQGGGLFKSDSFYVKIINILNDVVTRRAVPDVTFWLDISYDEMMRRQKQLGRSPDFIEKRGRSYFNRVIKEYSRIIDEEKRFIRVDGTKSVDDIFNNDILPRINRLFGF